MNRNRQYACCNSRHWNRTRRGTTVVETALVLPIFLLFVLGMIELGHAQLVKNVMRSACRQAARIGSTEGHSTAEVKQRVRDALGSAVDPNMVTIYVKDAKSFDTPGTHPTTGTSLENLPNVELSSAEPRQLFMIRAKVNYEDVAIVPNIPYIGNFLDDVVLEGQAFMRHE